MLGLQAPFIYEMPLIFPGIAYDADDKVISEPSM